MMAPHNNVVVIAPMIMKFGTCMIWYLEVFWGACFKDQVRFYFWKLLKFRYKETYGTRTSENLEHSLTNSLLW